jgi:hypothetical protein
LSNGIKRLLLKSDRCQCTRPSALLKWELIVSLAST